MAVRAAARARRKNGVEYGFEALNYGKLFKVEFGLEAILGADLRADVLVRLRNIYENCTQ